MHKVKNELETVSTLEEEFEEKSKLANIELQKISVELQQYKQKIK